MNYVITQVAKPQKNTVPQMQQKSVQNVDSAMNVYLENALVSLASAKQTTPDAVCILNCNFEIPERYQKTAEAAGVEIHQVPYGKYKSNEDFPWSITQYKFDSMEHAIGLMKEEDCLLMLDTDTVCVQNLDEIFEEAKTGLILYATHHGYKQKIRQQMLQNYQKMYGIERKNLVHYGGEFLAGSKAVLSELLDDCSKAITKARETQGLHPWADEEVFSIAVAEFWHKKIYPANAYIYRFWTNEFYLVTTNYYYDPLRIWHLPAEKNYGMVLLYEYFEKNHRFPSMEQMAKMVGMPGTKYKKWNLYRLKMRIRNKLSH
ncbi:MAG: hypothetical protein ACLTI1_10365 [Clostridia bacterium]